jgi:hypothetical protein
VASVQILGSLRGDEMVAATRAARVTQIAPEFERKGGLAMKTHGDAPLSVFFDARISLWRGRDGKMKVLCRIP